MPSPTRTQVSDVFRRTADEASLSLSKWLGRRTTITVQEVSAVPLQKAVVMLGSGDAILCVCAMHVGGGMPGVLALAVTDESGLALADLLLGHAVGTSVEWGDIERSAAAETTNIIGCAYLNAMATETCGDAAAGQALIPSPPWFVRDYPEAVMEGIILTQSADANAVFLTRTDFDIEDTSIRCSLVFVPEAAGDDGTQPSRSP